MLTLSNSLSFARAPLAFLFLQENSLIRLLAIFLAMVTDSVDGYLARRNQSTSTFGAILDPLMDKFFVYFALTVFYFEDRVHVWEIMAMMSRDFFLVLYGGLMVLCGRWRMIAFRAIRWGKVTTALQFIVLLGLTMHIELPRIVYFIFATIGVLAFCELLRRGHPFASKHYHSNSG